VRDKCVCEKECCVCVCVCVRACAIETSARANISPCTLVGNPVFAAPISSTSCNNDAASSSEMRFRS
jgi:hypothetical protein